jgi:hypothetical protein
MTEIKKEKKVRTPRTADSITAGALSLSLSEKVELVKKLKTAIAAEVSVAQVLAKQATELVNGL